MSQTPERPSFLSHVHSLRGVAIITVVLTHVLDQMAWPPGSESVERVAYALFENGSAVFLAVAGLLFQHLSARFRYHDYLRQKARVVIAPYVVMSLPLLVMQSARRIGPFDGVDGAVGIVAAALRALVTAEHLPVPFWFIPMMVVFYVLSPVFAALGRRPRALLAAFAVALPLGTFCHRPLELTHSLHAALYFSGAWLGGMVIAHWQEPILDGIARHRLAAWASWGGLIAVEVWGLGGGGAVFSAHPFSTEHGLVDLDLLLKLWFTVLALETLRRHDAVVAAPLRGLGYASFGIFFVHEYVILAVAHVARRGGDTALHGNLWTLFGLAALVTGVSYAAVRVAVRLTGPFSRSVIGVGPSS